MQNNLSDKDKKAFALIRNMAMHYGRTPTLNEINEVTGGKSPRSASLVISRLVNAGFVQKEGRKFSILKSVPGTNSVSTIDVPLIGSISCGLPTFAEENIEAYIPISTALAKKGSQYFMLRATGNSMDKAGINNGDILLIKLQQTAENGDRVVALINDEATVKVFEKTNDAVILRPKSSSPKHKPIILTENCQIQGVVIATLPSDLN